CSEATGACASTNNTASCDDGNFCTSDDVCADGACTGGGATACDDDDVCTTDSCDEAADTCTHGAAADGISCDDDQFCTVGDTCGAGACIGGCAPNCDDDNACTTDSCNEETDSCAAAPVEDGLTCDDGVFCTIDDVCHSGTCVGGAP